MWRRRMEAFMPIGYIYIDVHTKQPPQNVRATADSKKPCRQEEIYKTVPRNLISIPSDVVPRSRKSAAKDFFGTRRALWFPKNGPIRSRAYI